MYDCFVRLWMDISIPMEDVGLLKKWSGTVSELCDQCTDFYDVVDKVSSQKNWLGMSYTN